MRDLEGMAAAAVPLEAPVLIEGESGTGKETLARHLHRLHGGEGDFPRLSCGREEIWEGVGQWLERAGSNGARTLFLKNVHLLPASLQGGLLRALQGPDGREDGVRLMASANQDLETRVSRGEFRADLYFRLSACRLTVPALRQRPEDIADLFRAMLPEGARSGVREEVEQALAAYSWPGNFWELRSVARGYAAAPSPERLMEELRRRGEAFCGGRTGVGEAPALREQVRQAAKRAESEIILRTLERHRWNRRRAAKTLKISYRALMYKMKELPGTVWEGAE